jgi:hypothetical protein
MKFSFASKYGRKPCSDPKIKRLTRTISRPPRVYEVRDIRAEPSGKKYVGNTNYRKKEIYIDKTLTDKQKRQTVAHEVAHFKLREKGFSPSKFGKDVKNELRRTKIYHNLKQQGYQNKKIPEEAFANYYMQLKTGSKASLQKLKQFERKYPTIARTFSKLAK